MSSTRGSMRSLSSFHLNAHSMGRNFNGSEWLESACTNFSRSMTHSLTISVHFLLFNFLQKQSWPSHAFFKTQQLLLLLLHLPTIYSIFGPVTQAYNNNYHVFRCSSLIFKFKLGFQSCGNAVVGSNPGAEKPSFNNSFRISKTCQFVNCVTFAVSNQIKPQRLELRRKF